VFVAVFALVLIWRYPFGFLMLAVLGGGRWRYHSAIASPPVPIFSFGLLLSTCCKAPVDWHGKYVRGFVLPAAGVAGW
jgi:hypothetical protein